MHNVGEQPSTWQANSNLRANSATQDTQAVLCQVASLKQEFDKLTGDILSQKKRIDDANGQHA